MWDAEIERQIVEVEEAAIVTSSKVGTWQVNVLKTILKTLLFILHYMKDKEQ